MSEKITLKVPKISNWLDEFDKITNEIDIPETCFSSNRKQRIFLALIKCLKEKLMPEQEIKFEARTSIFNQPGREMDLEVKYKVIPKLINDGLITWEDVHKIYWLVTGHSASELESLIDRARNDVARLTRQAIYLQNTNRDVTPH